MGRVMGRVGMGAGIGRKMGGEVDLGRVSVGDLGREIDS